MANFKNELFLLQNGLRTGLDRQEMLAKFGIKEQVMQDTIEVVSEKNENKIVLFYEKGYVDQDRDITGRRNKFHA